MRPEPIHIIILILVIVVVFGAAKLPMIAKNLGRSAKVFRDEVKTMRSDDSTPQATDQSGVESGHKELDAPSTPQDATATRAEGSTAVHESESK